MNPIAQKILDCGGTICKQPLLNLDGSLNEKLEDELFSLLGKSSHSEKISKVAAARANPKFPTPVLPKS